MKEQKSTTHAILSSGVELASIVAGRDVDLGEVTLARDLDVVRGLHEEDARKGAVGNKTRPATALRAPRDLLALGVTDGANLRRSPQAEVGGRAAQKGEGQYNRQS